VPTPSPDTLELIPAPASDPHDAVQQRESLRRLVEDVQRLPEQQRSALLMREISGMAYQDLATALDVTVPAVKSLLVRARIGLAQAAEARDTACDAIRIDLADAHERGVRASGLARRHMHDCSGCRAYRRELKSLDARFAALIPALGPGALLAKLLGIGGVGGGAAAGGGASAAGGATAVGAAAGAGAASVSATHIVAAVAVAVVSAGGAVEVQRTLAPHHKPIVRHMAAAPHTRPLLIAQPASAATAGAHAGPEMAARHRTNEHSLQLRLRVAPTAGVVAEPVTPAPEIDAIADGPGNGGAVAPVEPTLEPLTPTTPPPTEPVDPGATSGDEAAGSGSASGASTGTTPPPSSPPPVESPPAASAAPAPPPAVAVPPTSATTGGAAYVPPSRHR
jgi:hypothetical protein